MYRKLPKVLFMVVIMASMILAACAPAATPAPAAPAAPAEAPAAAPAQPAAEAAPTEAPAAAAPAEVVFQREETLYTTGVQWGPPSSWNPWNGGGYSVGTLGLIYETLFTYDPLTDKFNPWLAESATWVDDTTWEVKLRDGLTWTDGKALTADDVKFTVELADPNGKYAGTGLAFQNMWKSLDSIEKKDDLTLDFKFKENPPYQEVGFYFMYQVPIVPMHLWEGREIGRAHV